MDTRTLLRVGGGGTVVAALCCATPILVILLGASASRPGSDGDYVLIPALAAFIGITLYATRRRRHYAACCVAPGAPGAHQSRGRS